MMVAVLLGALTLGACVDDNESQSVTDVRNAKAEQLKSIAAMNNAEAQAKMLIAEANVKIKEQEAALKKAEADKAAAEAKIEELKAKMAADTYDAKLAAELAQAQVEKAQAESTLAYVLGEAQQYQLRLQAALAELQVTVLSKQADLVKHKDDVTNAELDRLEALAKKYGALLCSYTEEQNNLANLKSGLVTLEAGLTDWKADKEKTIAKNNASIKVLDEQIALYKKYANYTENIDDLKNKITVKQAEYNQAADQVTALNLAWTNMKLDVKATDKMRDDILATELTWNGLSEYDAVGIYFASYNPVTNLNFTSASSYYGYGTIVKGDYELPIDTIALEIEAKDVRALKVGMNDAIAALDVKGKEDAINTAKTGLKAVYDAAVTASADAKKAYEAAPTDAAKKQAYTEALAVEATAKSNYDDAVETLASAKESVEKLNKGYDLVSNKSYTDALVKAVKEYNDAIRTLYTPKAEAKFAYLDADKVKSDINDELTAMNSVYYGTSNSQQYMTINQWLYQNENWLFDSNNSIDNNINIEYMQNGYRYSFSIGDIYSLYVQNNTSNGAFSIDNLVKVLEAQKEYLLKENVDYSAATSTEQTIALKKAAIAQKEGVIKIIEIQMNKAKELLAEATKDATPAA
ncbi:hypothetical protein [Bacteroides sp.]|uniref:hypothetical protein n=1 Tax=Bacteroides sp. TaxID=29523 RepID=UPI00262BF95C|nr:hypothetical protein [Bacteroides sp.]